ncbi:MAG: hypothetical protein HXX14_07340 [Bacteroidetes bacterium]|nr:hypothetical protein [Bacteroidota bacterium]
MKIKPVKQKREPGYPTIETYIDHPELLSRNIPLAWIKNQYAATTLATFIICSCGNQASSGKAKSESIVMADSFSKDQKPKSVQNVKKDSVKIARIFSHGDGSGAIGCEVMSPPVFISEDEARKIIFDALKAENIVFDTNDCQVLKFSAPDIASDCFSMEKGKQKKTTKVELKMDGYNAEHNLAIEFVSIADFEKFKDENDRCMSSVQGYDTKKAAELIREELRLHSKTNAAVFYDPLPLVKYKENIRWDKNEKETQKEAREQLLAQVKDFIDWIKKEGIIKK